MSTLTEQKYRFTLLFDAIELTTEIENAIYEAGCDDCTIGIQGGQTHLTFARLAPTLKDAIATALRAVERAGLTIDLDHVQIECPLAPLVDAL